MVPSKVTKRCTGFFLLLLNLHTQRYYLADSDNRCGAKHYRDHIYNCGGAGGQKNNLELYSKLGGIEKCQDCLCCHRPDTPIDVGGAALQIASARSHLGSSRCQRLEDFEILSDPSFDPWVPHFDHHRSSFPTNYHDSFVDLHTSPVTNLLSFLALSSKFSTARRYWVSEQLHVVCHFGH